MSDSITFAHSGSRMNSHCKMRSTPAFRVQISISLLVVIALQPGQCSYFSRASSLRAEPLWRINEQDSSVQLAPDLSEAEAEAARKVAVNMLSRLYERQLLPYKTRSYARTKGVLDRVPLERFMEAASHELVGIDHDNCLEWGPYFKRWPNVTQPYMKFFKCKSQWTFAHDSKNPRVRKILNPHVFGDLDHSLTDLGLDSIREKFDLVILPQTLQYVLDPHLSMSVLFSLVKPGGHLVFSTPFMQTIMPYPTDYFRFTAEGNEQLLRKAGFEVLKSYVGGDDFWSICWIMHCGVSDLTPVMMERALMERGGDYSRNSYMLSAQLARRPEASSSAAGLL